MEGEGRESLHTKFRFLVLHPRTVLAAYRVVMVSFEEQQGF